MLPVLGSSTVGLVDLFLKFSSVAVRKRSAPFYKYSFWSFLCNPPVLPSFPCLGMLGFFFSSAVFHFEDSRARLSVLVSVTLYCAGVAELWLKWPPGDAPLRRELCSQRKRYKQLLCQFFSPCWHRE